MKHRQMENIKFFLFYLCATVTRSMSAPDHAQPSGQPCFGRESYYMILKQRSSFCLWHRVKTETDECSGSRGHLAASIQTDQSFTVLFFFALWPSTACWNTELKGERSHTIAPLHLSSHTHLCLCPLSSVFRLFLLQWHIALLIWLE